MSRPRLILVSLALNALLLGAVGWKWRPVDHCGTEGIAVETPSGETTSVASFEKADETPPEVNAFHWSQLDTANWTSYRDGLRRIGCPGGTVRDIITPQVHRHFAARIRALAEPYFEHFWERLLPPTKPRMEALSASVEALESEEKELLGSLFSGGDDAGVAERDPATDAQLDFLPPATKERVLELEATHREQLNEFASAFQGTPEERKSGVKILEEQLNSDVAALLTAEELDQLKLRRSRFASLRDLEGVNLSEDELAELIQMKEAMVLVANPNGEALPGEREAIERLLDPQRGEEFIRAQNQEFQSLLSLTSRLGASPDQAHQLWEAHEDASAYAQTLIDDTRRPEAERRAELTTLREDLAARAEAILGGPRGRETWERSKKNWLDQSFQLPEEDPLAPPPEPEP